MRTSLLALVAVPVAMTLAACGDGGTQPQLPPPVVPVKWSSIAVGTGNFFAFACGLTVEGKAYCWGDNSEGQLGTGTHEESLRPAPVSGILQFASLSAGWKSACALTTAGEAWCWGELVPNGAPTLAPTRVSGGLSFRQLSHGLPDVCALTAEGVAWCWSIFDLQPVPVPGGQRFAMLTTGTTMLVPGEGYDRPGACGVTFSGEVYCWTWANTPAPTPSIVPPIKVSGALDFVSVSIGGTDCGVTRDGAVYCLEGLESAWRRVPFAPAFVSVAQGRSEMDPKPNPAHACALTAQGIAHCWGGNSLGQLGTGDLTARPTPTPVAGGHVFSTLAVGGENSCGVTVAGEAYCWGVNTEGQLGIGTKSSPGATSDQIGVRVPTRVLDPLR